jgi:diacylglycerol kinase (ATP)
MSHPPKHIALLCNPTPLNTKALKLTAELITLLQQKGIAFTSFTTSWPQQLNDFSEVWIVGGDGTMNYFVNHYKDTSLPLALFAGGTGNDFHWMLYGNCKIEEQVERVLKGRIQHIDAGMCNGYYFLNGLGIGFDGSIVYDLMGKRKWPGKLSYILSILKNIMSYKEQTCSIRMGGKHFHHPCFMISVANGKRYGGGFFVAPKADAKDGVLDVSMITKVSLWQRLHYLPVMEKGKHLHLPFVQYQQTNHVVIEAAQNLPAQLDGEYLNANRFEVKILPAHFSFLV